MGKGTGAKRHVHKYFRMPIDGLWHCGDARCTHFMPGNMPPPLGKDSICWKCGRPFELNADHLDSRAPDHPTCETCPAYDPPKLIGEDQDDFDAITEDIQRQLRDSVKKVDVVKPVVPTGSLFIRKVEESNDTRRNEEIHGDTDGSAPIIPESPESVEQTGEGEQRIERGESET